MPSYRLGQAAKMLGVSADTVRRMVDDGRLRAVRSSGGQRLVDGASLARLAKPKRAKAPDVVVARSARNRFPGIITRVVKDRVAAQVEIQAGPHRLVSLSSRAALRPTSIDPIDSSHTEVPARQSKRLATGGSMRAKVLRSL